MSDRTQFQKASSENPSRKDMPEHDDSKTQPAKTGFGNNYKGNHNGDGHDFNVKAKVTDNGSSYNNVQGGLSFNGAQKDASISYLDERGKKGITVASYSSTERNHPRTSLGKDGPNHGLTAYNSSPIPETYKSATSEGQTPPNAVEYKTKVKGRGNSFK